MEKKADVSIITVNYNGLVDTLELIESLYSHLTISFEVIVVDNASVKDETIEIKQSYPDTVCIRSDINLGFAGGNNLGIRQASGKYLLMLNNDTIVKDDSLKYLIAFMDSDEKIGGVSPKIMYADSPDCIQYAGATELSAITLRNETIGLGESDTGQYNTSRKTSFLHGAAMMIRREIIEKVGLMPELYFLYYEEIDWSTRIKKAGFELWYNPECVVYHKESRSVGEESYTKVFYMTRNRMLYTWRNRRGVKRLLSLMYLWSVVSFRNTVRYIIKGKWKLLKAVFLGNIGFLTMSKKNRVSV